MKITRFNLTLTIELQYICPVQLGIDIYSSPLSTKYHSIQMPFGIDMKLFTTNCNLNTNPSP